jgi:hypothetical protein
MAKNVPTTKLPIEKRLRIDLAVVGQGLRRGEYKLTWVPSRANLADPLAKRSEQETARISTCTHMKKPLIDAMRTGCTNIKGVRQETKTQADVSRY